MGRSSQVQLFFESGFVVIRGLASSTIDTIPRPEQLRDIQLRHEEYRHESRGGDLLKVRSSRANLQGLWKELMKDSTVAGICAQMNIALADLRPNAVVSYVSWRENNVGLAPHLDPPRGRHRQRTWPDPQHVVTAGVALDDFPGKMSGGTTVFPGSHRKLLNFLRRNPGTSLWDLMDETRNILALRWPFRLRRSDGKVLDTRRGDVVLMHPLLIHGASINWSLGKRKAIRCTKLFVRLEQRRIQNAATREAP